MILQNIDTEPTVLVHERIINSVSIIGSVAKLGER